MSGGPVPQPAGGDPTRASDRERDATADRLQAALAEGRLDIEEYQQRLDAAMRARTRGDLAALVADLPRPVPTPVERKREVEQRRGEVAEREQREWYDEWRTWAGAAVVMSGIWLISSLADSEDGLRFFWPVWPLGIWALVLLVGVFGKRGGDG